MPTAKAPTADHVMKNGVTIYQPAEFAHHMNAIEHLVQSYPKVFRDAGGVVRIPEEDGMPIRSLLDVKPASARVYPVGKEDRRLIHKEFNKLHDNGKLSWTAEPTPYGYSVFVVWRTAHTPGKEPLRKRRVVVGICELNRMTKADSYPMSLQSGITIKIGLRVPPRVACGTRGANCYR